MLEKPRVSAGHDSCCFYQDRSTQTKSNEANSHQGLQEIGEILENMAQELKLCCHQRDIALVEIAKLRRKLIYYKETQSPEKKVSSGPKAVRRRKKISKSKTSLESRSCEDN